MELNGQSLEATATPEITENIRSQTGMTNQGLANSYEAGGVGRGLLNAPSNFNSGLSFSNNAETDAIKARYMPQYQRREDQLRLDNLKGAQMDHLRNLQVATRAAAQEVEQNKQKAILKDKIEKMQRAQRGQVLGSVLGIVGGVVGGIYGGPAGAAAGYSGGQAVGNAAGSA